MNEKREGIRGDCVVIKIDVKNHKEKIITYTIKLQYYKEFDANQCNYFQQQKNRKKRFLCDNIYILLKIAEYQETYSQWRIYDFD